MPTTLPTKVKISDDVLFQEVAGDTVLLNMESEYYFGLNATGTRVWELLSQDESPESVFQVLKQEYKTDETQLRTDLAQLIAHLAAKNLVTIED